MEQHPKWPVAKRFNTAGPCQAERHYMLPPLTRLPGAIPLINNGDYFVLHAPRQSGKTTILMELARELTATRDYAALYLSCEAAEAVGDDTILSQEILVREMAARSQSFLPRDMQAPDLPENLRSARLLTDYLAAWCAQCPRRVVLLLDEVDALRGQSLITVLRQLRAAFNDRPATAPWSVVLCGLRDVRDYKTASGGDGNRLGTASPFNIKVSSLTLSSFTHDEVFALLDQHTDTTGQPFRQEAKERIAELSEGQPWLTNALARTIVEEMETKGPITQEHVEQAKEKLILARATHIDSLLARLGEPRIRRVLEPLIAGEQLPLDPDFNEDVAFATDLGLVKTRPLRIANPIYTEVLARVLGDPVQDSIETDPRSFIRADGLFDLDRMLHEFCQFWVEHGETMADGATYRESGSQLVLMAFLQRVVNGGGQVTREYGVGRKRIDLLISWPWTDAQGKRQTQREALEIKVWRPGQPDPLKKGLEQLEAYLDRLGLETGTLVLFDRRPEAAPLEERIREEQARSPKGREIRVLRA